MNVSNMVFQRLKLIPRPRDPCFHDCISKKNNKCMNNQCNENDRSKYAKNCFMMNGDKFSNLKTRLDTSEKMNSTLEFLDTLWKPECERLKAKLSEVLVKVE